jgi:hypothetical protein
MLARLAPLPLAVAQRLCLTFCASSKLLSEETPVTLAALDPCAMVLLSAPVPPNEETELDRRLTKLQRRVSRMRPSSR